MGESESPRSTIRRTTALVAASLLLVVVTGVPAWAGASITPAEVEADIDQGLTLTVTEPGEENEAYGDTARVVVRPPTGFTMISCGNTPVGWSCATAEDGTHLTLTRTSPLALANTRDFGFTVHTSPINGQYAFRVTQADGPPPAEGEDPPATVTSRPAVSVIGGQDPPPEPKPTPTPSPKADDSSGADDSGDSADGGGTDDGGGTNDGAQTGDEDGPAPDEDDQDAGTEDTGTSDSGSTGGSTAPRRTQGRASGTTLEITPGEPVADDPAIAPPAVADDPAVAPPSRGEDRSTADSTAAAAAGASASDQPGRGSPWQQWVGGAMLLAGLATVGVRWLRQRRAS